MLLFWLVVGLVVLALALGVFGLTRLGGNSRAPGLLFGASLAAVVVGFVIALTGVFVSGPEEPYPGPAADMGSERPEAAEADTEMPEAGMDETGVNAAMTNEEEPEPRIEGE